MRFDVFWRLVYCLATWLALPLVLGYFAWRARREPAYRQHWRERLGFVAPVPADAIWVHAASVGEVVLIAPLVEALAVEFPQSPLLITTMTPTGRERAHNTFGQRASIHYAPLDTLGATRRFMRRAAPRIGILVETELWPNLIAAAADRAVPLVLVNASVSARSAARYARFPLAGATRFMLSHIAAIGAASEAHAQRFATLGAPVERIEATGNLKYDTPYKRNTHEAGASLRTQWQAESRPVWVAASTHEGEETLLLQAFQRLRAQQDRTLLVIAPRHPQRFDTVAALLADSGWTIARRSIDEPVSATTDIVLADTLGEVPMFYSAADVVFVGGSAVAGIGGHNVLEPAALGRVFCVGPYVNEWQEIVDGLEQAGAARVCQTPVLLADTLAEWIAHPDQAAAAGAAGRAHVRANAGALDRSKALVITVMTEHER